MESIREIVEAVRRGDRRALARLLSRVENGGDPAEEALSLLYPQSGRAHIIGLTGAPGSGKSSLTSALVKIFRNGGFTPGGLPAEPVRSVAVLAVDPSSPFSGGALLGDRIRMRDLAGDGGVYIRSMASRGAVGGLAHAAEGVVQALDAAGFDIVMVETVGAGQSEVEIARHAHSVVVVESPGRGDDIQALKAGILEIADVIALNKADLPGAEEAARALRSMLDLGAPRADGWKVQVLTTDARKGAGVEMLAAELARHREHLRATGLWDSREEARVRREVEARLRRRLVEEWSARAPAQAVESAVQKIISREITPADAVENLIKGKTA